MIKLLSGFLAFLFVFSAGVLNSPRFVAAASSVAFGRDGENVEGNGLFSPIRAGEEDRITRMVEFAAESLFENPGHMALFALSVSGMDVRVYLDNVLTELTLSSGIFMTVEDCAVMIYNAYAVGLNPRDANGYDLVSVLFEEPAETASPLDLIYELYVFSSLPENQKPEALEQRLWNRLLTFQTDDGAFTGRDGENDAEMTAMAVTVLSRYRENAAASAAIDRALGWLSLAQEPDGCFFTQGVKTCGAVSNAIIALVSNGIGLNDERFVKNGYTLLDALLSFAISGNGFQQVAGKEADTIATEQALIALATYKTERFPYAIEFQEMEETRESPQALILSIVGGGLGLAALICAVVIWKRNRKKSRNPQAEKGGERSDPS